MSFWQNVKTAARFLSPRVQPTSSPLPVNGLVDRLEKATLWLTPDAVRDFEEQEFTFLPAPEREQLQASVEQFRRVVEKASLTEPATKEQVEEALPALLKILNILRPYLADPEEDQVRAALILF